MSARTTYPLLAHRASNASRASAEEARRALDEIDTLRAQACRAVPLDEAIAWHDVAIALAAELANEGIMRPTSPAWLAYNAARNGRFTEAIDWVASIGLNIRPLRDGGQS